MLLTGGISVDQYTFDAFADSWLEDKWFMDEMTDITAHPLMAINANTGLSASTIPPCAGSLTVTGRKSYQKLRDCNRFRPVASVKQTHRLTYQPRRRV
jgi:hypothetical protein